MGDSGASRTLLTEKSARFFPSKDFNPHEQCMEVVYGGGDKAPVVSKVQVSELEVLVVPQLQDNLVSLYDFTDKGSTILLSSAGGLISNSLNDKQIVLNKDDGSWRNLIMNKVPIELILLHLQKRNLHAILLYMNVLAISLLRYSSTL